MATTSFYGFVRPRPSAAIHETHTASFNGFVPIRTVSGRYTTVNPAANTKPKRWKPSSIHPIGKTSDGKEVLIDPTWAQFLAFLGQAKLGGANFPTLPELTSFILTSQNNAIAIAGLQSTLEQMVTANAQSTDALVQVVQGAGLTGAIQIPPVVITRPETAFNPILPDSPGAGAGGDGGGGDGG